jgi:hypothetical protein
LLERDCGIEIARATMCGWVMTVGEMLMPVIGVMRRELLATSYIQADETPVDARTHDKRGKNHQGYLRLHGTPGGAAVFDFRMSRGRQGPARFLDRFEGILQTDGYIAYESGVGGPKMVHACCWSHARRHFVDAVKLNRQDAHPVRVVELMDKLFLIDAQARGEKTDRAARHLLRQQKAPPLLDEIREHILATSKTVLPRSKAGQACSYALELNPDELLNADLKQRVTKAAPARTKIALTRTAIGALRSIQKQPNRVERNFEHDDVCYAAA